MRFAATDIFRLKLELEREFDALDAPKQPKRVYACATADLPPAANFKYCVAFDTTAGALVTSNGTAWV